MLRKRFFHIPIFHTHREDFEKKVSWLELFYDLVYVAAFIQLGDSFSKDVSTINFLKSAGIFLSMWLSWTGFTYYANRFTVDDVLHRTLVILKMFCVGAMAISIPKLLQGDPFGYGLSYACSLFIIALLYFRSFFQQKTAQDYSLYWGGAFSLSALFWISSLFYENYTWGWFAGCLVIFIAPCTRKGRSFNELYPFDFDHLFERYGLLTIIVLGESFVKVLSFFSTSAAGMTEIFQASFALMLTCSIWWIYFDDIANSTLKNKNSVTSMIIWLFAHLPLQFAIVLMGVGVKKVAAFPAQSTIDLKYSLLLGGSIGVMLLCAAVIDSVTERKNSELNESTRINSRVFAGILILLIAFIAPSMTNLWFIGGCLFVCLFQVVFDIFFSPYEFKESESLLTSFEFSQKKVHDEQDKAEKSMGLEIIRKGLPNNLKKDLYFYFMDASWWHLFFALFFIYILSNIFFAVLFTLVPQSIANANGSFFDAFFFSVQTMSTIGYGTLSPNGDLANLIVTLEAAFGLVCVAVITGLIFAKISKPSGKILFSHHMIYSKLNGKDALSFRVSNARGNDIVQANMTLTVLLNEITEEGEHFRRMKELKLLRENSPFFRLTWTVTHIVDESSPLYGIDLKSNRIIMMIANFVGHDGTYSNTIYAQQNYLPRDIEVGKYFADIIHHLPDGRMIIDYAKFQSLKEHP